MNVEIATDCSNAKIRYHVTFLDDSNQWRIKTQCGQPKHCYGISEDSPKPIATNRRKLYPIFSEAKKICHNGLIYTVSTQPLIDCRVNFTTTTLMNVQIRILLCLVVCSASTMSWVTGHSWTILQWRQT